MMRQAPAFREFVGLQEVMYNNFREQFIKMVSTFFIPGK